jgi:Phytanoyl-CoA dioxygenase (PhyH)
MATQLAVSSPVATASSSVAAQLEADGIAILPDFLNPAQLQSMQRAFAHRLQRLRWNDFDGYEKTERFRHMVQDVLTLEQGFVDAALHPLVKATLTEYIGPSFALVEAKGWLSLPTTEDFHGWHGDGWYDQGQVTQLQREIKLALYLTDVRSGAFTYVKGTHGKLHPRSYSDAEVARLDQSLIVQGLGRAGTAILFDTSGIHRQSTPILEPRHAVFYNYHDPSVPLRPEDVKYNRYHPLLLNAAFLGNLTEDDRRILGFGDKRQFVPAYQRGARHEGFQSVMTGLLNAKLRIAALSSRARARLRRMTSGR